jgi:parallel beta-helix repeat protein
LVEDNILIDNTYGIYNYRSTNVNLTGNDLFECGIKLNFNSVVDMETLTIVNCTVNSKPVLYSKSENGLTITEKYGQIIIMNGTNIHVMNQTLTNVELGLDVWYSEDIEITNCSFRGYQGIQFLASNTLNVTGCEFKYVDYGIELSGNTDILIFDNNFDGGGYGVYASEVTKMNIYKNNFNNNYWEGVNLESCGDCIIYWNNFTGNGYVSGNQAYDSFPITDHENLWYNNVTNEGNYWSDYSGTGSYTIPGDPDNVYDLYPLSGPYLIPEFSSNLWLILTSIIFSIAVITVLRKRK